MTNTDSFGSHSTLEAGGKSYSYFRLQTLIDAGYAGVSNLPFSMKILLENLLRYEDGRGVVKSDVEALANWKPNSGLDQEISFTPSRVLLQDFTGVPGGRRPRVDARGDHASWRRPEEDQPAPAGRPRHRPLRPGRLLRPLGLLHQQCGARVRAQQGALSVPSLGPAGVFELPRGAARDGHRSPGEPRVSRSRGLRED